VSYCACSGVPEFVQKQTYRGGALATSTVVSPRMAWEGIYMVEVVRSCPEMCRWVGLSVRLPVCLPVPRDVPVGRPNSNGTILVCLPACLPAWQPIFLSVHPAACPTARLSAGVPV
jgi:hypothetical protein